MTSDPRFCENCSSFVYTVAGSLHSAVSNARQLQGYFIHSGSVDRFMVIKQGLKYVPFLNCSAVCGSKMSVQLPYNLQDARSVKRKLAQCYRGSCSKDFYMLLHERNLISFAYINLAVPLFSDSVWPNG